MNAQDSRRFISIGTKLSALIFALLSVVFTYVYFDAIARAREGLGEAKLRAASMVTDLVAASLEAALDFDDAEATQAELDRLSQSPDVIYAVVWRADEGAPIATLAPRGRGAIAGIPASREARTALYGDRVEAVRDIVNPKGRRLGGVAVQFSFARENAAYELRQRRILLGTIALTLAVSVLLIGLTRRILLSPVMRLAAAVRRMEGGGDARVPVTSTDEIGVLGSAFNEMAAAITDRERRLAAARASLQEVLDNMRQAIVVFGPGGVIEGAASRQAEVIFGDDARPGRSIKELLYPDALPSDVEPLAFEEWLAIAFETPADQWSAIEELAPREVILRRDGHAPMTLAIELRPVIEGESALRIMLLATDETDKRRLEREVASQEREHAKQMAAMRRLVASGAQAFLSFLNAASERLARCEAIAAEAEAAGRSLSAEAIGELFRHAHTLKGEARSEGLRDLEADAAALEELLDEARGRLGTGMMIDAKAIDAIRAGIGRAGEAAMKARSMFVEASPIGAAVLDQITVSRAALEKVCDLVAARPSGSDEELERAVTALASRPFGESVAQLLDAAPGWAIEQGKKVEIVLQEGREMPLPPEVASVMRGALTHLVRNAIVHGVETPDERERAGKNAIAVIRIRCLSSARGEGPPGFNLTISVEDDGRGLDFEAIRAAASALQIPITPNGDERRLIFHQGLSTHDGVSDLAGRGVGLAAVAADLASIGWEISVASDTSFGTRFTMTSRRADLPAKIAGQARAPTHAKAP